MLKKVERVREALLFLLGFLVYVWDNKGRVFAMMWVGTSLLLMLQGLIRAATTESGVVYATCGDNAYEGSDYVIRDGRLLLTAGQEVYDLEAKNCTVTTVVSEEASHQGETAESLVFIGPVMLLCIPVYLLAESLLMEWA